MPENTAAKDFIPAETALRTADYNSDRSFRPNNRRQLAEFPLSQPAIETGSAFGRALCKTARTSASGGPALRPERRSTADGDRPARIETPPARAFVRLTRGSRKFARRSGGLLQAKGPWPSPESTPKCSKYPSPAGR